MSIQLTNSEIISSEFVEISQPNELYYKLNESSGTSITDYSGKSRTGTATNATVAQDHPFIAGGYSRYFDGTGDYIRTNSSMLTNQISVYKGQTYEFWTKCNRGTNYQSFININSQGNTDYLIIMRQNSNIDGLIINTSNGTGFNPYTNANFFTGYNNIWVKITVTINYYTGIITIYRNGEYFSNSNVYTIDLISTTQYVYFGSYQTSNFYLNGNMSEVKIFDRTLDASEIKYNYENDINYAGNKVISIESNRMLSKSLYEVAEPNELYYKLDSLTVTDYSGKARTGTVTNAVVQQEHPFKQNGNSLYFDGTGDYVSSDTTFAFNQVSQYKGLTFEFWVKCSQFSQEQCIVSHGTLSDLRRLLIIRRINSDTLAIYTRSLTDNPESYGFINFFSGFNSWVKVTLVIDCNTKIIKSYRNGLFFADSSQFTSIIFTDYLYKIYIGSTNGSSNYLNGYISELKIFDRILSADEIAFNYQNDVKNNQNMTISIKNDKILLKELIETTTTNTVTEVYYNLRESSGGTINDISAFNRDGTIVNSGGNTQDHPYIVGSYCKRFASVNIGHILSDNTFSLTNTNNTVYINIWVKSVEQSASRNQVIVNHGIVGTSDGYIVVDIPQNTLNLRYKYTDGVTDRNDLVVTNFFTGYTTDWVKLTIEANYVSRNVIVKRNDIIVGNMTSAYSMVYPNQNTKIYLASYQGTADKFQALVESFLSEFTLETKN